MMEVGRIGLRGTTFRDATGRHVILRGVNFGGDCKVPFAPDGHTWRPTDFADHRTVSFVGRPAPLHELDDHLSRLRRWGFNCLRLLTTWEAVEHAGPGEHDEAYLDYLTDVCRRAGLYGLRVIIDFHQDAWARMSGGDGAPGWTFEAAGLDFTKFGPSGAAHLMQHRYDSVKGGRQEAYPVMSWSGNYARPANGIMWSLFFGGRDFAPGLRVGECNVQDYLQHHYFGAMRAVAERVADQSHVIGFDTLNEPSTGYIGASLTTPVVRYRGPIWSALDGLALASGIPRDLPVVAPGRGVVGAQRMNEDAVSIWLPGREDPFRVAGVWDMTDGRPVALQDDHFLRVDGREVEANRDYMAPFFARAATTIRAVRDDWLLFAEVDPFGMIAGHGFPVTTPERTVNASHWYDLSALVTKRFSDKHRVNLLTGEAQESGAAIEDAYLSEMTRVAATARTLNGGDGAPTLLGECGIQYDMNDADAYSRWAAGERDPSIWAMQTAALDLMYNAIDRLLLSSTQWNYTVSNSNDPMIGDGWNQEDLSIWSADQVADPDDPDSGARGLEGFCRPFVRVTQGTLVSQKFDRTTGTFEAVIEIDPAVGAPTEIYVGEAQYRGGWAFEVVGASGRRAGANLMVEAPATGLVTVRVSRT
jgi:hypothetical protein